MSPFDAILGTSVALALPRYTGSRPMRELMTDPPAAARTEGDPDAAIRAGMLVLRALGRLRLPYWKNTCLFRSVLRCVILRRAGRPAVLKIGAAKGSTEVKGVVAHAWVEVAGEPLPDESLPYTPLRGAREMR